MVMPVPRFLGRSHAGERAIRNRRPDSVASSRTRGATPRRPGRSAAAWRRCGRRARRRTARSRRRRARWSCRRRWGRTSRNRPASESASKSTSTVVGERAERGDLEGCSRISRHPRQAARRASGSSQQASQASSEQRGLGGAGRRAAQLGDEVEGDVVVAAAGDARPRGSGAGAAPTGLEGRAPGCAGTGGAAAPSPAAGGAGRSG